MATNLKAIRAAIVEALAAVTELQRRYDHEPADVRALPATTLWYRGFGQTADAVMPNSQDMPERWVVRVCVALQDEEKAQEELLTLVPKVIDALYADRSMGSTCLYNEVPSGDTVVVLTQDNAQLIMELNLVTYVRRE